MLTSATEAEFTDFLTRYGYAVAQDTGPLLALSELFMMTLPWCDDAQESTAATTAAQCFIAYAMSAEGGAFNPAGIANTQNVKSQKVDTLEKEFFAADSALSGTDAMSLLKRLPVAYGLLSSLLCETDSSTHKTAVFVV